MPGVVVDGNDFSAVAEASSNAVDRARKGDGPTLIECKTYRHRGHSKSDRNRYRTKEEIEEWKNQRDPITQFENELMQFGVIDKDGIAAVITAVDAEIAAGIAFAQAGEASPISEVLNYVYSE